jgi:hypothetical protein
MASYDIEGRLLEACSCGAPWGLGLLARLPGVPAPF